MKIVEILNLADKVYPTCYLRVDGFNAEVVHNRSFDTDGFLKSYYDDDGKVIKGVTGDTLAEFIVIELTETYDANATTENQLRVAKSAIARAINELADIEHELDLAMHEIPAPADSCKQEKKACCGKCHK